MNIKQYYKIGAYVVGLMCLTLLLLILQAFGSLTKPSYDPLKMTMAQELRAYRQVLNDIKSSSNPKITSDLKNRCNSELIEVNNLIDQYENGEAEEISLRTRLDHLSQRLLSDPYLSTKGRNTIPMLNSKLDL